MADLDSFFDSKKSKKDKKKQTKTTSKAAESKAEEVKKSAADEQAFDDVANETIKKVKMKDNIKIVKEKEAEVKKPEEVKQEETKQEEAPAAEEQKKKDASTISFGGGRFQVRGAAAPNKGTKLQQEEFPDLDNVGKTNQKKPKAEPRIEKAAPSGMDAPAIFNRAEPRAEQKPVEENKGEIKFGGRPTFSKQAKKAPATEGGAIDVQQQKMLELMNKDLEKKEELRKRAEQRRLNGDADGFQKNTRTQEPEKKEDAKAEAEPEFEVQHKVTEVRRGGGRGYRGGRGGGAQRRQEQRTVAQLDDGDDDFQIVTNQKRAEAASAPAKEQPSGNIQRGQNRFGAVDGDDE